MADANTFKCKPIGDFVRRHVNGGIVVDPFSRSNQMATVTNDLNPEIEADYHMEAAEFLKMLCDERVEADVVIFDPPYSLRQCAEVYKQVGRKVMMRDMQIFGRWKEHKDLCAEILKKDGVFLHFGWHSNGLGKKRGFAIEEILLVSHGGAHNDTICIAERRNQWQLAAAQHEAEGEGHGKDA